MLCIIGNSCLTCYSIMQQKDHESLRPMQLQLKNLNPEGEHNTITNEGRMIY